MKSTERPPRDPGPSPPQTLGDVIYRDAATSAVSEKDWVRLVHSMAAGDLRALHALYSRTHRIVFTLTVRITGNRQTAEEVTLDVFNDVWRRAAKYDASDGSVLGWILNQARSRAIDRVQLERRKKRAPSPGEEPAPATDPAEAFGVQEQQRLLRSALAVLTPDERQAVETAFFSEQTYGQVAAQLNQPLGTVKTRIRSALGKLQRALRG